MKENNYKLVFVVTTIIFSISTFIAAFYIQHIFTARSFGRKVEIRHEKNRIIESYHAMPLSLTTQDGYSVASLLVVRPHPSRIFLLCHGFRRTKEYMRDFMDMFPNDIIMCIDFRGQGESSGQKISLGLHEHIDIFAAVDYLKNNFPASLPLIGIGISQGGAALLRSAAYGAPFNAIISDSAPSDFKYTVAQILQRKKWIPIPLGMASLALYEWLMGQSLCMSSYKKYAHLITCPVLIMHDTGDRLVDYRHAEKIYHALTSSNKELWSVTNTLHGRLFKDKPVIYKEKIENFLNKVL